MPQGQLLSGILRDEQGNILRAYTLAEHSDHVAAYCSRQGEKIDMPVTAYLGGLLHDAGQAKKRHQEYVLEEDEERREQLRGTVVHSRAGALIIEQCLKAFDANQFAVKHGYSQKDVRVAAHLAAETLQVAIMGHHTGLTDCYHQDGTYVPTQKAHEFEKEDRQAVAAFEHIKPFDHIKQLFEIAVEEMFQINEKIRNVAMWQRSMPSPLTGYPPSVGMAFFMRSLLAKWITSTIVDAERYDYSNINSNSDGLADGEERTAQRKAWETALRAAQRPGIISGEESLLGDDGSVTGRLMSLCDASGCNAKGIYSFVAPGGPWKTVAGIRFALAHAAKEGYERIIYVATDDYTAAEAAEVIRRAVGARSAETLVSEFHAGVFDDELEYDEENLPLRESRERWKTPVVVTTQRLFMDMLYAQKGTEFRKLQSVTNAAVLFEDVQVMPVKLTYMFVAACVFLSKIAGCTIVVGSESETGMDRLPFWQIDSGGDIRGTGHIDLATTNVRRQVIDLTQEGKFSPGKLALRVSADSGTRILVVMNTDAGAERVAEAIQAVKEGTDTFLLNSRMCQEHISDTLTDIEARMKVRSKQEKQVIVCTAEIARCRSWTVDSVYRARAGLDDVLSLAHRCTPLHADRTIEVAVVNTAEEHESDTTKWKKACYETVLASAVANREGLDSFAAMSAYLKATQRAAENPQTGRLLLYTYQGYTDAQLSAGGTLTDAFGANATAYKRSPDKEHFLRGSFGVVGTEYCYDEQRSTPVIVPYNRDAERLIRELSQPELNNIRRSDLVRQAQKYTVRIPDAELEALKEIRMIRRIKRRVYICNADWYDKTWAGLIRADGLQTKRRKEKGVV